MSKEQPKFGEVFIFRHDKDWTAIMYVSPPGVTLPADLWIGLTISGVGRFVAEPGYVAARVPLLGDDHWREADDA